MDKQDPRGELIGQALTMAEVFELRKRLGLSHGTAPSYRSQTPGRFDVFRKYARGGTVGQDPRARARRAPFRLFIVTLSMQADDGTGYLATRTERAQDGDDASGQAQAKELEVQAGRASAGGVPHKFLSVVRVRLVAGGRVT